VDATSGVLVDPHLLGLVVGHVAHGTAQEVAAEVVGQCGGAARARVGELARTVAPQVHRAEGERAEQEREREEGLDALVVEQGT
jgi:hypothetical protein